MSDLDYCPSCGATWDCEHRPSEAEAAGMTDVDEYTEERRRHIGAVDRAHREFVDAVRAQIVDVRLAAESARRAFASFTIAFVDNLTPAFERFAEAMWPLAQWMETARIMDGELEPFGFREVAY